MRHTNVFDTHQPLIYHICTALKPILWILCHITFRNSFEINIVNMRHRTCFDTIQPLVYHLCTALKPILFILCHITSYSTPQHLSISIKLQQRIAFRYSLKQHSHYEVNERLWYTPAPCIPPLYSLKTNIMRFMTYNFLYHSLSLFQFRSTFISIIILDLASI